VEEVVIGDAGIPGITIPGADEKCNAWECQRHAEVFACDPKAISEDGTRWLCMPLCVPDWLYFNSRFDYVLTVRKS